MEWVENIDRIGALGIMAYVLYAVLNGRLVLKRELDACRERYREDIAKAEKRADENWRLALRATGLAELASSKKDE